VFAYTVRRLLQMVPLLFAASVVIYALLALQPGDPLDELRRQNPRITAEQFEALKRAYGLDQPLHIRYFKWLSRALRGDLGYSRTYGIPAAEYIFDQRLPTYPPPLGTGPSSGPAGRHSRGGLLGGAPVHPGGLRHHLPRLYRPSPSPTSSWASSSSTSSPCCLPDHIPGFPAVSPPGGVPPFLWDDVRSGARWACGTYLGQWAWHLDPARGRPVPPLADGGVDPVHAGLPS
jgi:peptide/nickel transport system permease protein